jgi:hypothetical protein
VLYDIEPPRKGGGALKKELIHSRKITVNCYETDGKQMVIEGSLTDERHFPYMIHAFREKREAGLIHDIALRMDLTIPRMEITSISAEMPVVPDPGCRAIREEVQKLKGRFIQPGFTNEVRELFGRAAGCLHLTNLVLAMSSAAIQGLWSHLSRVRDGISPPLPETDRSMLIDSCHMWRKEGPFVERLRRRRMTKDGNEQ